MDSRAVVPSRGCADGGTEDEVLQVAAAVESCTRHPVADAILSVAERRGAEALETYLCACELMCSFVMPQAATFGGVVAFVKAAFELSAQYARVVHE